MTLSGLPCLVVPGESVKAMSASERKNLRSTGCAGGACQPPPRTGCRSVVVLESEMGDQFLAAQVAQGVLELHQLNEEVVFGVEAGCRLRALEVEGQPLLHALHACPLGEVEKERQVQHQRRGEDGIPAEEVDLDLHRIA